MKELSTTQTQDISGGFWILALRIIGPTLINMGVYALRKKHNHEEITTQGLAIAAGSGAIAGGIAGLGGAAAGGGLVGNAVWLPGAQAINISGNAIAQKY